MQARGETHAAASRGAAPVSRDRDAPGFFGDRPGPPHAAQLLGDGEARLQAVLVEARAEMRAAEPDAAPRPEGSTGPSAPGSPRRRKSDGRRFERITTPRGGRGGLRVTKTFLRVGRLCRRFIQ